MNNVIEENCVFCNTYKNHNRIGVFYNQVLVESDDGRIALCPNCLGTGTNKETPQFLKLVSEVWAIEVYCLALIMSKKKSKKLTEIIEKSNQRLVEIAGLGLDMVSRPIAISYAKYLVDKNKKL